MRLWLSCTQQWPKPHEVWVVDEFDSVKSALSMCFAHTGESPVIYSTEPSLASEPITWLEFLALPRPCQNHRDREALPGSNRHCEACHGIAGLVVANPDLILKVWNQVMAPNKTYAWAIDPEFLLKSAVLLRQRGEMQASFLLNRLGDERLTELAIYFGSLGNDLVARMERRNRSVRVAVDNDIAARVAAKQVANESLDKLFED